MDKLRKTEIKQQQNHKPKTHRKYLGSVDTDATDDDVIADLVSLS